MTESSEPSAVERLFERWSAFAIRYRWFMFALALLAAVGAVQIARKKLKVDRSAAAMTYHEGPEQELLDRFEGHFGSDDLFLVVVEGDVFTLDFLERLRALHEELRDLDVPGVTEAPAENQPAAKRAPAGGGEDDFGDFEGIEADQQAEGAWKGEAGGQTFDEVTSLLNARRTTPAPGGIKVGEWLDPFPTSEAEVAALRAQVLKDEIMPGRLVGAGGHHAVILLRTFPLSEVDADHVVRAVAAVVAKHRGAGFEAHLGGSPALRAVYADTLKSDTTRFLLVSFIVICLVLAFLFRNPWGVIGPAVIVLIAALMTLGFMAAANMPITLLSSWLPAFILTVGVSDSLHVLAVYRELRHEGMENNRAIARAMSIAGPPAFLASFLTLAGLLCFDTSSIDAINNLGTAGGLGGFLAYFLTLTLLPAFLSFNKKSTLGARSGAAATRRFRRVLASASSITRPVRTRRTVIIAAAAATVIAGLATVFRVEFRNDRLSWLPQDLDTVKAFHMLDQRVGGSANVQLLIEMREGHDVGDPAFLRQLESLDRAIRGFEHPSEGHIVMSSMSPLDILRETNRAVHDADQGHYQVPDAGNTAHELLFLFESADPTEYHRYVTDNDRVAQITFRVRWLDAVLYQDLIAFIDDAIAKHIDPKLASVRATGSVYIINEHLWKIMTDLARSFLIALIVISIWLVIMLRSLRLGLAAMLPNLFPIVLVIGGMAIIGTPVNIGVLLAATVCLGLVVDDTIHFFHHCRHGIEQGMQTEEALQSTLEHAGLPMMMTTVVLALGFGVFAFAQLGLLRSVAGVAVSIIAGAGALELLLTPALIRTVSRPRSK